MPMSSRPMSSLLCERQVQPVPGQGPFFGAGRLLAVPILTSFVSLPLASSWSSPPSAACRSRDKLYLAGEHRGTEEGMGEAKVNNGRHQSGIAARIAAPRSLPCPALTVPENNTHQKSAKIGHLGEDLTLPSPGSSSG